MTETEVITTPEVVEKTPAEVPTEKKEQTISEALETKAEEPKEKQTVGLDKYLAEKKSRKELEKRLEALEAKQREGATKEEMSEDMSDLAEEFDIDPKFLSKLEKKIRSGLESEFDTKLKPLTEEKEAERIDRLFKSGFEKAIGEMPEYANVVNPEVIKQLSLNPANGKKTFAQLIEETYGNAVGGKRTLEASKPTGRNEPEKLDYNRATSDQNYFKEVMANPALKKEYNDMMLRRTS